MIRQHFKYPYLHEIWLAYCRCLKKQEIINLFPPFLPPLLSEIHDRLVLREAFNSFLVEFTALFTSHSYLLCDLSTGSSVLVEEVLQLSVPSLAQPVDEAAGASLSVRVASLEDVR